MAINISTEAELRAYAANPTDDALLLNDINLTEGDWTPINRLAYSFNGAGHTISGVNVDDITGISAGFISTTDPKASNLRIKNLFIEGDIKTTGLRAGGIVGYLTSPGTQITNCRFKGAVTASRYAGGVIGMVNSAADGAVVARCQVDCYMISTTITNATPFASGIVGHSYAAIISQHNFFYGRIRTFSTITGGVRGIGSMPNGIITACVVRATKQTVSDTGNYGISDSPCIINDSFYYEDSFGLGGGSGAVRYAEYITQSTYEAFGNFDFVNMWELDPSEGPYLREVSDYTFVPIGFSQPEVPSTQPTTLRFHATKAGTITPTLTFTGGPIEVFTETSQVGPVTNYTSQGTFTSGAPKSLVLTLGQRLYFAIPTGTSITAMDFTDDQITGTLDSEAIQTFAEITLTNSGWRRYYIEKTLEYLDSVGYAGVFHAKDGNIPGIFTDASLTARTNILARGTSVVNVNLAQKGAGTYNFTLPFRTDGVDKVFQITIARNNATYITSVTCVIKDSGGNTVHTLTPAAVSNSFVCNATIASIGEYTAEWSIVLNPTGLTTDSCSYIGANVGTVIHTFDIKDIPVGIAFTNLHNAFPYKTEIGGDISDFSEMTPSSRLSIGQFYPHFLPTLFGDITTLKVRYQLSLGRCENVYGNIENMDWYMGGISPYNVGFSENNKIVGDVDCLKDLNYPLNNSGAIGFVNCQGVHGSIQNWKSASVDCRGCSNITGPINSVVSNYAASFRRVYGSGFTLEQLEESIDILANAGFVYKGSFIARGTGYGPELATSNQTTIDQIASLIAGGANIQVKTVAVVYDFTLSYDGAEVGDVYWIAITPTTNFIDYKITFPAGAFVRADNGDPVTEWTENMSPNVRCVIAGDYDIRWQFGWDGMGATIFNMLGGPAGSRSKHTFDVSLIPDACHTRQANLNWATNVTGDISKFSNTSESVAFSVTQSLSGSIASLTQQTYTTLDLRESSLGGVVSGGAANCNYYLDGSKLTKSDIAKSLIYLNNRDPLYTGNFWCSGNMPAITDKKGIEAYDALVARLGDTKIRVNVDREGGTVPVVSSNRLRPSSLARLQGIRRF